MTRDDVILSQLGEGLYDLTSAERRLVEEPLQQDFEELELGLVVDFGALLHLSVVDLTFLVLDQIRGLVQVQDISDDVFKNLDDGLPEQVVLTVKEGQQCADILVHCFGRQLRKLLKKF